VRDELFKGDFAHNMKLLQKYPPTDLLKVLQLANTIREDPTYAPPIWVDSTQLESEETEVKSSPGNTGTGIMNNLISASWFRLGMSGAQGNNNTNGQ